MVILDECLESSRFCVEVCSEDSMCIRPVCLDEGMCSLEEQDRAPLEDLKDLSAFSPKNTHQTQITLYLQVNFFLFLYMSFGLLLL